MSEVPYYKAIQNVSDFLDAYKRLYSTDYQSRRASAIINFIPAASAVLDLGCGGGVYSAAAARKGGKYIVALDYSPVCVKAARINMLQIGSLEIQAIVGNAVELPFRSEAFDLVLCIDLIEHVQKDDVLISEIGRVLKPKGRLLIATQNSSSLNYLLEGLVQRWVLRNRKWMGWDPTHVRFYTYKSLRHLLNSQGFEIIMIGGTYFVPYMLARKFQRLNRKLAKLLYLMLKGINETAERRGHRTPFNKHGWGIFCLCAKK